MKKYSNLLQPTSLKRRITFFSFDIIAFSLALLLSFQIKFEFSGVSRNDFDIISILLIFLSIKLAVFFYFKLYEISWKFVSLQDIVNIAKACIISSTIIFIVAYGFHLELFNAFPRSIILIDLIFSFLFSAAFKISKRFYLEVMRQSVKRSNLKRTLIIGAGSSGEQLLRDINRSDIRKFNIVGFVDDDPRKQKLYMQGIKVIGTVESLPEIIKKYNIESILISVISADRNFHRKVLNIARESGVSDVKVVSTINDVSNALKVSVQDIRDIEVSDLIGRQAVSINTKEISTYIKNKKVLITGAAGSIGSEIARQAAFYHPTEIGILDLNESDLASLELQMKRIYKSGEIKMFLCDISCKYKVDKVFEEFNPDIVFHAAAYKHVPVMEKFPEEAVRVNIIGTHHLTTAAIKYGVDNFILISTDKAVNPSSIMGASKRIAENIIIGAGKKSFCNFVAVRFGNVIGSRGSALPVFLDQIKNGGPITITHPDMKRYFMTIPEAVALVLQAATTGKNGDVFVLDMGEPIRILDIVTDLILLNNLIPGKDIEIEYTGIREGEKLFEEVLTAEEGVISTNHEKIFKARLVCLHDIDSIKSMINDFQSYNGSTTKKEWLSLFKYYVPSFAPNGEPYSDESLITVKSKLTLNV